MTGPGEYLDIWKQLENLTDIVNVNILSTSHGDGDNLDFWCHSCKKTSLCEDMRNGALVCTECCIIYEEHMMDNTA